MQNENETLLDIRNEIELDWASTYHCEGSRRFNGEYCDNEFVVIDSKKLAARITAAYMRLLADHRKETAKLQSLLDQSADLLSRFISCRGIDCDTVCGDSSRCIHKKAALIVTRVRVGAQDDNSRRH